MATVNFAWIKARVKAKLPDHPDQQANEKNGRVLPRICSVVVT